MTVIDYANANDNPRPTKDAWMWVISIHPDDFNFPGIMGDLYFSSPEKFRELLGRDPSEYETLAKVQVPADFDDWDYIPGEY